MSRIGKFSWHEVITSDPEKATHFYKALFGWKVEEMPMGDAGTYRVISNNGKGMGGIVSNEIAGGAPSHWYGYLNVDDVDATASKVKKLGGEVYREPMDVPGVGRFAVVTDAQGAVFAPFKTANPPQNPDDTVHPGDFGWDELHASDPEQAFSFYSSVIGWTKTDFDMGDSTYFVMHRPGQSDDDRGEGGVMKRMSEHVPPMWLTYVAVSDVDATQSRAAELGGNVMMPATDIPNVGRFTIFADPTGAVLAAITFAAT